MLPSPPMTVRLLLVGEPSMARDGVEAILHTVDDFHLAAVAEDTGAAVRVNDEIRPDVVVMDAQQPTVDGLAVAEALAGLVPVVVLARAAEAGDAVRAVRAGVAGLLLSGDDTCTLVMAIRAVAAGDAWFSPPMARQLRDHCRAMPVSPDRAAVPSLTRRERGVVALVARGRSNAEIAAELSLSQATIKTHVSRILNKLELRDRVQLAAYAHQHRLT